MSCHAPIRRHALFAALLITIAVALLAPSAAIADTSFKITGGGYGHAIGLSQYGAKGYAEAGWPHTDILRWYYGADRDGSTAGVQVRTLASLGKYANPSVKVHIDKGDDPRASWTLRGWQTRLRIVDDNGTVAFLSPNDYHKFTVSNGKVSVAGKSYTGTLIIRPETTATVSTPLIVVRDASGPFGYTYVRYRGEIRLSLYSGMLRAINVVPLEKYLYGVVPRESPSSWHMEALKAQAVAARSYAWATNPPSSTASSTLSGILHCTTFSQVYGGHSRLKDGTDVYMHEAERSNDAVDATTGQIVYHSPTSKIVTTYFSASSGGHTADIEDVWVSSDPKPYYRGVSDRDNSGNPYYSWDAVTKTGASIASALGQSSRGTVTSVSHEKAASGHVRYATFRFSNGTSYRISGDSVRSKLGLKSTKFTIGPVNVWRTYQQTDTKIGYAGSWRSWSNSRLLGGSYKYANKSTGLAVFTFKGTGFKWVTTKYNTGGYGDVYVDGVKLSRVNLYTVASNYRSTVWSKTGLSADTTHTVIIHVTGKKTSASRGTNVGIDAVQVLNGALLKAVRPSLPTLFDDTDSRIDYAGTWTGYDNALLYGGSYRWAREDTDTATFRFIGTRARLITMLNTTHGKAYVYLDAREPVLVDAYGASQLYRQPVWDSGALPFGVHTVHVVPTTDKPFGIDRIDIWAGQLAP